MRSANNLISLAPVSFPQVPPMWKRPQLAPKCQKPSGYGSVLQTAVFKVSRQLQRQNSSSIWQSNLICCRQLLLPLLCFTCGKSKSCSECYCRADSLFLYFNLLNPFCCLPSHGMCQPAPQQRQKPALPTLPHAWLQWITTTLKLPGKNFSCYPSMCYALCPVAQAPASQSGLS